MGRTSEEAHASEEAKLCTIGILAFFHETEIYCEYLPVKAALLATSKITMRCDIVKKFLERKLFLYRNMTLKRKVSNNKSLPLFDHAL